MITRHTMSPWLYFPVYCRRLDRNRSSQFITGHRTSRYILCRSPLPLRPIHRSCIRHYRWFRPLVPTIHGLHTRLNLSKNPLPHYIRGSQYDFLPSTLFGPVWNTSPILRLPRRLHNMKHGVLHRIIYLSHSSNPNGVYSLRSLRIKTRGINSRTYDN